MLAKGPVRNRGQGFFLALGFLRGETEEACLAAQAVPLGALPALHGPLDAREELRPRPAQRVRRAGFDQTFQHPAVEGAQVHLLAELDERPELARLPARLLDGLHRGAAEVLDSSESETDAAASGDRHVGREVPVARIDVRRQTWMPISWHSLMYFTILAVLPVSEVSRAAMKSSG